MRFLLLAWLSQSLVWAQPVRVAPGPPPIAREFRGVWIASVGNLDWPSRPGSPPAQQQAELRRLLDNAVRWNLNVVILQVRPSADALYESNLEPWSEYLTGRMGQMPNPRWDPLKFACDEAHARGLELHAWFNPFRARHSQVVSPVSSGHVTRARPDWVVSYGLGQWLDPGIPVVREHVQRVVLDVVRRYDIDGLHFDDYFYPYPYRRPEGGFQPFPDDASYGRYVKSGGRLERDDWRRDNVNQFMQNMNIEVHKLKPWLKFGISPFGIWRPDNPPGIKGLDQYAQLYSDPRLWLQRGWCDYFAPQLYWPMAQRAQSFSALLAWWRAQNAQRRLLVPGLNSAKIGMDRSMADIAQQVRAARQGGAEGVIFWNASSLQNNLGGLANQLVGDLFVRPALVPATPWLGSPTPAAPKLVGTLSPKKGVLTLGWSFATGDGQVPVRRVVVRSRVGSQWQPDVILGTSERQRIYDQRRGVRVPDEVRLVPIGPTGTEGPAAVWMKP